WVDSRRRARSSGRCRARGKPGARAGAALGMSLLDKAISLALPAVPKPIVGHFSKRYIAGPSVDDALRVVRRLADEGAMTTLDILGEFISSVAEADANAAAYVDLLRRISSERLPNANVSVKLSALGLLLDRRRCLENM